VNKLIESKRIIENLNAAYCIPYGLKIIINYYSTGKYASMKHANQLKIAKKNKIVAQKGLYEIQ
jgi:hypothetical protein